MVWPQDCFWWLEFAWNSHGEKNKINNTSNVQEPCLLLWEGCKVEIVYKIVRHCAPWIEP